MPDLTVSQLLHQPDRCKVRFLRFGHEPLKMVSLGGDAFQHPEGFLHITAATESGQEGAADLYCMIAVIRIMQGTIAGNRFRIILRPDRIDHDASLYDAPGELRCAFAGQKRFPAMIDLRMLIQTVKSVCIVDCQWFQDDHDLIDGLPVPDRFGSFAVLEGYLRLDLSILIIPDLVAVHAPLHPEKIALQLPAFEIQAPVAGCFSVAVFFFIPLRSVLPVRGISAVELAMRIVRR